jgi:hypothetical protein
MAIGDTVQAGLMRVDFSPIQRAGEAQARANQAFGQALGGIVDKFYQKKKDKQEKEQLKQAYLKLGMSEEVADAAKNDKDLANQFINKMNADRNYDLQVDQFNQAEYLRNLQGEQILQNIERQKTADELKEEVRAAEKTKAQNLNRFIGTREMVDMPIGVQDQNPLMRGVEQPTAQVPQGDYKGNRFMQTEQGRNMLTDMVDSGIDPSDALATAGKFEAQLLANQPKAPDPFEARKYFDKSINDMRKEYNSLDEVKAFKPVRAAFLKVKQSAEKPSAAGDLALVFNYMKILDPGSVVRESEFRTAADASAWLQKSEANDVAIPAPIAKAIRKLKDGTILTDSQRKDFVNIARKAASAQFAPVKDSYLQYRNIVNQMELPEGLTLPDNYQMIEDELAGQIPIESSSNAITTDQGNYTIPGLSVEAQ